MHRYANVCLFSEGLFVCNIHASKYRIEFSYNMCTRFCTRVLLICASRQWPIVLSRGLWWQRVWRNASLNLCFMPEVQKRWKHGRRKQKSFCPLLFNLCLSLLVQLIIILCGCVIAAVWFMLIKEARLVDLPHWLNLSSTMWTSLARGVQTNFKPPIQLTSNLLFLYFLYIVHWATQRVKFGTIYCLFFSVGASLIQPDLGQIYEKFLAFKSCLMQLLSSVVHRITLFR